MAKHATPMTRRRAIFDRTAPSRVYGKHRSDKLPSAVVPSAVVPKSARSHVNAKDEKTLPGFELGAL